MIYNMKERLFARVKLKNGVNPLTLQAIYPDFDLVAGEADAGVPNEELNKHLERGDENILTAFSMGT